MVLGTTYYNAARSAVGNRPSPVLALCNACLALLVLVAAGVAGDAGSPAENASTKMDSAAPERLPSPELQETPTAAAAKKRRQSQVPLAAAKEQTSVLLPPIQSFSAADAIATSTLSPPPRPSSNRQVPLPSRLGQPTSIKRSNNAEADSDLEVIVGQPRVLTFPDVPHRLALVVNENDPLATLKEVPQRPRQWYLLGKKPGITFLDVWLPDPTDAASHRLLHYLVRILPENARKEEKITAKPQPAKPPQAQDPCIEPAAQAPTYQTLEQEINKTFAGSMVHLKQVGDKLMVSGTARNLFEAWRILNLAREYAPVGKASEAGRPPPASSSLQAMLDNYAHAGGPHIINLLRIPGEQQIMLRVIVAEVNRPAARCLGLDFGIADKEAIVLPSRPAATDGSSTVADNGWVGQLLRILQDLHYAKILAEPTLTTLNGQAARFKAGGEFPIPVVSAASRGAVQGVVFRSHGVQLSIQPVLADVDRICLAVDAEVSGTDAQAAAQVGGTAVPGLKVRNFQSTVELREGETLAVAGLLRGGLGNTMLQNARPGLADPASADQELVVLISPLLLRQPSQEGGRDTKRLAPQDIAVHSRNRNTILPCGDAVYLIGPQGYAGKQGR